MAIRILIDARMFSGPLHGIARYAYQIASGVARLRPDWEVGVWTHHPQLWDDVRAGLTNVTPVPISARPFSLREQWELPLSAHRFGANVVHFCSIAVPFWLPSKCIATVHDLIPLHFPARPLQSWVLRYFTASILRRVRRIICMSQYTSFDAQSHFGILPETIEVIYNGGLDGQDACSSLETWRESGKPYFLCVSNPKSHKNIRILLEAIRPLEIGYDLVLISPSAPWLEQACLGRPAIRRMHGMNDDTLMQIYKGAFAVVVPSLYEGFGIPVLEAMQMGIPVISSRATSLPEVVGEAGLMFDPRDANELTLQMKKLTADPELRADLARRGTSQAEKFSWANSAREHVEVYEKTLLSQK